MAGVRLTYKFDDIKAREMLRRLSNFQSRAMFDEIGGQHASTVMNRFPAGEDAWGNDWIPSIRGGLDGSTLLDTGHLRDSTTYNVFGDGSGVEIGSNMIYAAIHQFGGKTGRNHAVELPARPFIDVGPNDEAEIDNIVEDHIRMALQ